jgi:hypothetical protein
MNKFFCTIIKNNKDAIRLIDDLSEHCNSIENFYFYKDHFWTKRNMEEIKLLGNNPLII